MGRRTAPEFRRPARTKLSKWIWWLLGLFMSGGLLLFVLHHYHHDRSGPLFKLTVRRDGIPHKKCQRKQLSRGLTRQIHEYLCSTGWNHVRHSGYGLAGAHIYRLLSQELLKFTNAPSAILIQEEKGPKRNETAHWSFNLTEELLSSTSFARQLADQMTLSKAYVVISKEHGNLQLAWELSSQIRNCQRLLSQTAVQGKTLSAKEAQPMIARLAQLIYRAQELHYDISTTIVTLKKHAQAMEERASAATAQSAQFGRMAAESLPKSLHCLNVMLLQEWSANPGLRKLAETHTKSPALADTNLYHFCVFSDNVLATSVVINSTVSNADHPRLLVFHIITDGVNYKAMASWFLSSSKNYYRGSSFEVRSLEEFDWLNASCSGESAINHLRFYIPEIYPSLERIVFLDDDVVVQKDLTQLFSLDLHGNVNGAVETCLESHHRFYKFLNFSDPWISSSGIDPQACGWAFGVNAFNLIAWKKAGVTERYRIWQERNAGKTLWKAGALPAALLAFYGLIEPLDRRWHVSGLGYDLHIDDRLIQSAAVLHFSGTMKPWLSLSPPRYMHLWAHYLHSQSPFLRTCIK